MRSAEPVPVGALECEHVTIPGMPAKSCSRIHEATASSQGQRSSSVSGSPDAIFSTFSAECGRRLPEVQPSWPASRAATVDFPQWRHP
jgi:hypothetical protein